MLKRSLVFPVSLLCALLALPVSAFAAAVVSVTSGGSNVYVLKGTGLQGVAGIDLSIGYDGTVLSAPNVTLGTLAGERFNSLNTGTNPVRLAVIDTVGIGGSGSGTIATIAFVNSGTASGGINVVAKLIDSNYKTIPSSVDNPFPIPAPAATNNDAGSGNDAGANQGAGNSGNPTSNNPGTTTTSTTTTTGTTGTTGYNSGSGLYLVGGTLTLPPSDSANRDATKDVKTAGAQPAAPDSQDRQAATRDSVAQVPIADAVEARVPVPAPKPAAPPAPPKPVLSVLERFRLFSAEKTVQSLTALFAPDDSGFFSQSPAIAIADGKGIVRLTIAQMAGERAPNFAFNAASYVSLAQTADGEWEVRVRPDAGVVAASVSVLANGTVREIPLTVAPKAAVTANRSGEVSEADFRRFLKERGTPSAPKNDLNRDGRRDYLDDYIYTANYLVKMQEQAEQKAAR